VKGLDLSRRVKVACRGRMVSRVNNPCKIQTQTTVCSVPLPGQWLCQWPAWSQSSLT